MSPRRRRRPGGGGDHPAAPALALRAARTLEQLARIVADPDTTMFVAEDDGRIVGTLTLAAFEIPTGRRAWIEDVVTDTAARGKGVASALVDAALAHAASIGARTVDLTSRPDREDANRLYVKLGFEQRRRTCIATPSAAIERVQALTPRARVGLVSELDDVFGH